MKEYYKLKKILKPNHTHTEINVVIYFLEIGNMLHN